MYIQKRIGRNRKIYFSFSYDDEAGKRIRLKKDQHPYFTDLKDAEAWANSQEGIRASKKAAAAKKLEWKKAHYNFEDLLKKYEPWQQEKAPNSYKENLSYLRLYVFPFFLTEKHSSNINDWGLHYQEFLTFLKTTTTHGKKKKHLAYATQNNIIRSLNTFLACLKQHSLVDPTLVVKCPRYPNDKLNSRDFSFVINKNERDTVFNSLKFVDIEIAEFFWLLWHTGLRFNEGRAINLESLHIGMVKEGPLSEEMENVNFGEYFGYLYIDRQLPKADIRNEDNAVEFKPLKGKKKIDPKYAKVVPIKDKQLWNILARRYNAGKASMTRGVFGKLKSSYLLFDVPSLASITLKDVYKKLGLVYKGFHSCRHSFATYIVGEYRSNFLARTITGHKSSAVFDKYLHIYEEIARMAKAEDQEIEEIA